MTQSFIFFCKTYRGDLGAFRRMLSSFHRFNRDAIHLVVSMPAADLDLFREFRGPNVRMIADEAYGVSHLVADDRYNLPIGYVNQQILKLCFWESGIAENYLCIDSDVIFIRDFCRRDFMADSLTPFSVLVMDKDLAVERHYQRFWDSRKAQVEKIFDRVGLNDARHLTCHGMQVLSKTVLSSLKAEFMEPRGLGYGDLLAISPFEFTWYNAWLQKARPIEIIAVEPFFKCFHMRIEYVFARLRLLGPDDWARSYVGLVLNSNWHRSRPTVYGTPSPVERLLYEFLSRI